MPFQINYNMIIKAKLIEQQKKEQLIKELKAKPPTNSENLTACMDRFEQDQRIIKNFLNRNIRPDIGNFDRSNLKPRYGDKEKQKVRYDLMREIRSAPSLINQYAHPNKTKLQTRLEVNELANRGYKRIAKMTRVRKVHEDLPEHIKKEDLDQDSLLTIDEEYNPYGDVQLYFEEFTRDVCRFKNQIGRKLVRNMKISDQGNAKNFNQLYKIIMEMDNNKNKVHTLVPFEKLVIEYP